MERLWKIFTTFPHNDLIYKISITCSNKKLLAGYNDLATTHPEIAEEWDYNKNYPITPSDVMAGSNNRKYWFLCKNGHSYESTLLNRKRVGKCPKCK